MIEKTFLFDVVSKIYIATDSSPVDMQSYELCSDMIDVLIDVSCIYGMREGAPIAYDSESSAVIRLNNGMVLYLKEINKFVSSRGFSVRADPVDACCRYLALVCFIREEYFEKHGLVDYNILCFKKAMSDVCRFDWFEVLSLLSHVP